MWGLMVCSIGSKFPSSHGVFGGYGPDTYPLCKVKDVDIRKVMDNQRDLLRYTIEELMNECPFPEAAYSTHHMGLQFELADRGELYMTTQDVGGGYGDVLERDPKLVASDYRDYLVSMNTVREIYHVALNPETAAVDTAARKAERAAQLRRGKPHAEFVKDWVTVAPPANVPLFGSWNDPSLLFRGTPETPAPRTRSRRSLCPIRRTRGSRSCRTNATGLGRMAGER
ncbi:hypothetical protein MXD62_20805 [Frankia sp. Mgl5]|uniref:hypothetical protein n=1 Tax=Frankia sp. Mgl5 TaxID=2933793 RepID=UPI002010838F|nr:hypothetical protein [Frankia sp. Mgl5]MCK9929589.1 hypothetical protein [Frankia sp. Mgl5]